MKPGYEARSIVSIEVGDVLAGHLGRDDDVLALGISPDQRDFELVGTLGHLLDLTEGNAFQE